MMLAFLYLAVPASSEIDVNLVNAQWHLAVLAAIIVITPPPGKTGRAPEVVALVLGGSPGRSRSRSRLWRSSRAWPADPNRGGSLASSSCPRPP